MAEEVINADGQTTTQDVEATETGTGVATNVNDDVVSKAEYDKAIANAEKREGRYKSTKKKDTVETVKTVDNGAVDVASIVKQELASIKEEEAFIRKHWEVSLNDELRDVMAKHPSLSMEDALKLTPVWQDPAVTANTDQMTMVWVAWDFSGNKNNITQEQLYSLDDTAYANMMDKIESWEMKLVD